MTPTRVLALLLAGTPVPSLAQSSTVRNDLSATVDKAICDNKKTDMPAFSALDMWRLGIYDAQVEGQSITFKTPSPQNATNLQRAAQVLAKRHGHHGYISGLCANGKGWVLSTPAPAPLSRKDPQTLTINSKQMAEHCEKVHIRYAAATGGSPRLIKQINAFDKGDSLNVNLNLLGDGTLSITCHPMKPDWQGPVVWYLYPVGRGPNVDVPELQALTRPNQDDATALLSWVNALRAQEKLPPLYEGHPQVQYLANEFLTKNGTIRHDRRHFRFAEQHLRKIMGRFAGENRVKAASRQEMAWLLWNSPEHRSLLLSREATHLAIAAQKAGHENLAVFVTAKF